MERTYLSRLTGTVVHGHGRGRTVGMPTANLAVDAGEALPPAALRRCDAPAHCGAVFAKRSLEGGLTHTVKLSDSGGTGRMKACHGVGADGRRQRIRHFRAGHKRSRRKSGAQGLPQHDAVGDHIVSLDAEPPAAAKEACCTSSEISRIPCVLQR